MGQTAIDERVRARVAENLKKKGMSAAKAKSGSRKANSGKKPPAEKNEVGIRVGSVLDTIYQALKRGSTREEILAALKKEHGDRDISAMEKTMKIQLYRMPKDKGFVIVRDPETKKYRIVTGKAAAKAQAAKGAKKVAGSKKGKKIKKAKEEAAEEEEEA